MSVQRAYNHSLKHIARHRGSINRTHGGDTYDHKSHTKALRTNARLQVEAQIDEMIADEHQDEQDEQDALNDYLYAELCAQEEYLYWFDDDYFSNNVNEDESVQDELEYRDYSWMAFD